MRFLKEEILILPGPVRITMSPILFGQHQAS